MSASSQDNDRQTARRAAGASGRDARLKAALKANMARRKAQARARAAMPDAGPGQSGEGLAGTRADGAGQDPEGKEGDNRHE